MQFFDNKLFSLIIILICMLWAQAAVSYAPDPYPSYPDTSSEEQPKKDDKPASGDEKPTEPEKPADKDKKPPKDSKPKDGKPKDKGNN
jgi:cytoskeletal protein RodZ